MNAKQKPQEPISAGEMVQSLTGFEELAIEQHMKIDPYTDGGRKPVAVLRSLVFVVNKRAGKTDREAREIAMSMPAGELQDMFADEPEEIDPDNPETPAGEDSAPAA